MTKIVSLSAFLRGAGKSKLVIDTHPGLNEKTLLSIAISEALAIVMCPDSQDYRGTAVTVEVARKLDVPHMLLIVNKIPTSFNNNPMTKLLQQAANRLMSERD